MQTTLFLVIFKGFYARKRVFDQVFNDFLRVMAVFELVLTK